MHKVLNLFLTILIVCIHIQIIYSSGNLYTTDEKNTYFIDNEQKYSWFDALTKCVNMKMRLVTIDSKKKSDEITALLRKEITNIYPLWIGAVANGNDRHYTWISNGQSVESFTNWYEGEPDFYNNNEYCLQTGWSDRIQWNDHECHKTFGLICEYNQDDQEILKNLNETQIKAEILQNELNDNQEKLKNELNKKENFQKDVAKYQEKLKDEMIKEKKLQDDLVKYQKVLQDELDKEQLLEENLNNTKFLLEALMENNKSQNDFNERKVIRNIFVNIN